jgi:hypothetical protein
MYKILGADHQEYGPATADQVRQWIIERRLNTNTLVKPEGSTGWQPLSFFPEFTGTLQAATPVLPALYTDERQNPLALTGFICSLLSILCCCTGPLFAVLGIVFSSVALVQINRTQLQRGRQLAIAGIVLGAIGLAEFGALMLGGSFAEMLRFFQ